MSVLMSQGFNVCLTRRSREQDIKYAPKPYNVFENDEKRILILTL